MAKTPEEIRRELWSAIGGTEKPGFSPQPQTDSALDGTTGVAQPMGGVSDIGAIYDPDDPGTPKTTLGDYLADQTEKNTYGPPSGLSYGTLEVAGAEIGDARVFSADVLQAAQDYLDLASGGGTADTREGGAFPADVLAKVIDKTGAGTQSAPTGDTLLTQIEGNDWDASGTTNYGASISDVTKHTVSSVLTKNRFSPTDDSPYIENRQFSGGMYTTQNKFGRYDPNANKVTLDDISTIGLGLILRQTGDTQDPRTGIATKSLIEGLLEQLAIKKVDTVNLEAGTMEGIRGRAGGAWGEGGSKDGEVPFARRNVDPTGALIDQDGMRWRGGTLAGGENNSPIGPGDVGSFSAKSYGALNSWLEPFDGPLPTSMILLSVIAAIATLIAGVIIGLLLDLIFFIFPPGDEPMGAAPKPLGASGGKPDFGSGNIGFRMLQWMGVPSLVSGKGFTLSMLAGVFQFFIGNAFPRLLGPSAGYYIVVCRHAIRDVEQIIAATINVNFKDVIGAVEGIFIILEAFATCATFTFLCTMAKLGDIAWLGGGVWGKKPLIFAPTSAQPDVEFPALSNLHMKSRTYTMPNVEGTDYGQAMRMGNLPSQFIMSEQTLYMMGESQEAYPATRPGYMEQRLQDIKNKKDEVIGQEAIASDRNPKFSAAAPVSTIPWESAQAIERALDTMYMPFYFKDLRTNEIIALNAFVEAISDGYSPKWNEVKGFGRTDAVQIYESTSRKIGLTFWVAAMDEVDSDEMWYIINRIVAMVYPQWSRGTQRASADGKSKFIQPFSQVPTASPIVRMRLGDLFRSNYTPRGLQRQFGYGTKAFDMKATDVGGAGKKQAVDILKEKNAVFTAAVTKFNARSTSTGKTPNPLEIAKIAIAYANSGGMVNTPAEAGFSIGDIVTLKPGKYPYMKSATLNPLKPKTVFGFKTMMKRYRSNVEITCSVVGYMVTPVGAVITGTTDKDDKSEFAEGKTKKPAEKFKVRYIVWPTTNEVTAGFEGPKNAAGIKVPHGALSLSPKSYKAYVDEAYSTPPTALEAAAIAAGMAEPTPPEDYSMSQEIVDFFKPENNAIARSFQASAGFGLAVAITQLDMDWSNGEAIMWDTAHGRRAPTMCKITMGLSPIHDMPLGLDADGMMTAPAYPAGNVVSAIFGSDPWLQPSPASTAEMEAAKAALAKGVTAHAAAIAEAKDEDDDADEGNPLEDAE